VQTLLPEELAEYAETYTIPALGVAPDGQGGDTCVATASRLRSLLSAVDARGSPMGSMLRQGA